MCDSSCDNKFKFCMRPYGYSTSSVQCPLGSYQSGQVGGNSITFNTPIDSNVPNPMQFNGSASWPVRKCTTHVYTIAQFFLLRFLCGIYRVHFS